MVLILYGFPLSLCTQRVAIVLYEKEVPFKFVPIDIIKGEQLSEGNLAKQPFAQVPYIDDDGYILYESRAISRYIAEKYAGQGTKLIPTDLKERGLFEQAVSIETSNFDAYALPAVFEKLFMKFFGKETNEEKFNALMDTLEKKLDVYESILSKQQYLAGDQLTLADLFHVSVAALIPATGRNSFEGRPNVQKWINALEERPSYQAVKAGVKGTID